MRVGRKWSKEEDAYIIEHYPDEPLVDLADKLGVSSPTVRRRAEYLGVKKSDSFRISAFTNRYVCNYSNGVVRRLRGK